MICSIYAACRSRTDGTVSPDNFSFDGVSLKKNNYGNKEAIDKSIVTSDFSSFALFEGKGADGASEASYIAARSLFQFNSAESANASDCAGYMKRYIGFSDSVMRNNISGGTAYSSLAAIMFRNGGFYSLSTGTSKVFIQRGSDIKELFGHTVGYLGNITPAQYPKVIGGRMEPGDRILICSSQLAHRLHSERINAIMAEEEYADSCADRLVNEAIGRGCSVATAMVFDVIEAEGEAEPWLNEISFVPVRAGNRGPDKTVDYPINAKKSGGGKTMLAVAAIAVIAVLAVATSVVLIVAGNKNKLPDETEATETKGITETAETTTEAPETTTLLYQTEAPTQSIEITSSTTTATETTTAASETTTTATTASGDSKVVVKDGITYVSGTLIANKTYSLPSDYNPGGLTSETKSAFSKLQDAAAEEGLSFSIVSGFRSYDYQKGLYDRYVSKDGQAAADRYSARPGHSEHQTGLAMDVNSVDQSFGKTPEGKWLAANCYKYGFIIRYPEGKESVTGYMYEPWHIRYLGVDLATKVYESGKTLEEYYGITSEYSD